jgi:hypothetical protein
MSPFPALRPTASIACFCLLAACGESQTKPPPKSPKAETDEDFDHLYGMRAHGEIGGLNEEKVDATFQSSLHALERCLNRGARRVEFLGGSVSFFVKIDTSGHLIHAHLEHSTLGDRDTEKCMLAALRALDWPPPVGGDVGLARKSFDFDPPNDVRPPAELDEGSVSSALGPLRQSARSCGASGFEVTAYVDTDGKVLAAGAAPEDEAGEDAVDCLVEAVLATTFPSPGSWPAKVTFTL